MFGMNVEWDHQQAQGQHRHRQQQQSSGGGFLSNLFGKKEEERTKTGHVYYYTPSPSRPGVPRRAETISVLPAGVKMPKGDMPEVSYGTDGAKYLVIPKRSNSTSRPRQIIVESGRSTPKRKDSTASAHHRATPRRSNSTQVRPTSPPVASRTPKIVGDPELVKHPRTPGRARRTSTR